MQKKEFFQMRLSKEEKKQLENKSLSSGFDNVSKYVLHIIHKFENKKTIPDISNSFDNGLGYHLSRLGNNLNQLAYNINKANLANKVNDKLAKEVSSELMYINIQIGIAIESMNKRETNENF